MMMSRTTVYFAVAALLTCAAMSAAQQPLADVARAEEARRKRQKAPSKTYTNESLRTEGESVPIPPPAAPLTPATSKPADATAKPDAAKTPPAEEGPKKDEKYWRTRITAVQQTLSRDKVLLDALQSRVNALNTDFANTSDPAQRAVVESNRKTALAEMDRVNKDIANQTKEVANIQDEARKANVPPGWLR
jgi:hypothetical protein